VDALLGKGNCHYRLKQYQNALDCYDQALSINPKDDRVWDSKGCMLDDMHRYQEAQSNLEQALALNPQSPEHHFNIGLVFQHLQQFNEAKKSFKKAIELKPNYTKAIKALDMLKIKAIPGFQVGGFELNK